MNNKNQIFFNAFKAGDSVVDASKKAGFTPAYGYRMIKKDERFGHLIRKNKDARERQNEFLKAYKETGSLSQTAELLNISYSHVKKLKGQAIEAGRLEEKLNIKIKLWR